MSMLATLPLINSGNPNEVAESFQFRRPTQPSSDLVSRFLQIHEGRGMGRISRLRAFDDLVTESINTGVDFSSIFSTIIDRRLDPAYRTNPGQMRRVVRTVAGADFRTRERHKIAGGAKILQKIAKNDVVTEVDKPTGSTYTYKVESYGKKYSTAWQDIIDDSSDLGTFDRLPETLAQSAIATEESFLNDLFMTTTGWLTSVFSTGNGGVAPLTSTLTFDNLVVAMKHFGKMTTPTDGHPMPVEPKYLMVGPALRMDALRLLNSTELIVSANGGTRNVIQALNLELIVNPWLPLKMTSGTIGDTAWGLFADPNTLSVPLAEHGLLRGHETPEILMKASNQSLVSGGQLSPMDGDFDRMGIEWKIMMYFGGTATGDARGAVVSNGQ